MRESDHLTLETRENLEGRLIDLRRRLVELEHWIFRDEDFDRARRALNEALRHFNSVTQILGMDEHQVRLDEDVAPRWGTDQGKAD